ncbi:MAG: DUF6527 family protein [Ignavibacteriales bacterium]|nr:DUF6527 family protein [Ignavibacteriales bacterium]
MNQLTHKFVKNIPEKIEDGVIYISIDYASVIHKCACGCGKEVVTPLSPTDWKLIFDGKTISLYPSIGNWNFACQSHYWIERSQIKWAPKWSKEQIATGVKQDKSNKKEYYSGKEKWSLFDYFRKK